LNKRSPIKLEDGIVKNYTTIKKDDTDVEKIFEDEKRNIRESAKARRLGVRSFLYF
jgi:hypothetical protein